RDALLKVLAVAVEIGAGAEVGHQMPAGRRRQPQGDAGDLGMAPADRHAQGAVAGRAGGVGFGVDAERGGGPDGIEGAPRPVRATGMDESVPWRLQRQAVDAYQPAVTDD